MGRVNQFLELCIFTATDNTRMIKSGAFRNQGVTLVTTGFSGTIKFYASNTPETATAPDLSSTANSDNSYSVVQTISLQDGSTIDGNVGVVFTTNTGVTRYEINDNNANWVGVGITRTAGTVEVRLSLTDNK